MCSIGSDLERGRVKSAGAELTAQLMEAGAYQVVSDLMRPGRTPQQLLDTVRGLARDETLPPKAAAAAERYLTELDSTGTLQLDVTATARALVWKLAAHNALGRLQSGERRSSRPSTTGLPRSSPSRTQSASSTPT